MSVFKFFSSYAKVLKPFHFGEVKVPGDQGDKQGESGDGEAIRTVKALLGSRWALGEVQWVGMINCFSSLLGKNWGIIWA